jgi:hypothetical protein
MKIDLKKSVGDFLSVNTFPPKLKCVLLNLSVLHVLGTRVEFIKAINYGGKVELFK